MRIVALMLICFALLWADHDDDHHYREHYPMDMDYLDLSHKQHEKVEDIVRHYQKEYRHYNKKKEHTIKALRTLFEAETFDKERAAALIGDLRNEAAQIQATFFDEIHTVLNKNQRRRFSHYMQEWNIE